MTSPVSRSSAAAPAPRTGRTFAALALALGLAVGAVLAASADPVQGARMVIRLTARTSLVLFLLAFTASAMARLWRGPRTQWLLRHRRAFGLAFAFSHAVHLVAILAFARLDAAAFAQQTRPMDWVTGGIAYVFIALLAATSWDGAVRWMGVRRWRLLHTVGIAYLWISFMATFGKRIPMSAAYGLAVALLVAALVLRVIGSARVRQWCLSRRKIA